MLLILALSFLTIGFMLFALHRCALLFAWYRHRDFHVVAPCDASPGSSKGFGGDMPFVTVQLPVYNEKSVVERLLRAVAEIEWPRDRYEIQVLDDSTDETCALVDNVAAALRMRDKPPRDKPPRDKPPRGKPLHGTEINVVRRLDRSGFKAGALANGMLTARGEFIAIFDSDFLPPRDFLKRTIPHFADDRVGMVQTRWTFLNESESMLTRAQALSLVAHFRIEHFARHASGCFFNFNGTAGVWRARTIQDAGGWQGDTLTEDLDLSYRAQLRGWRFVYRDDVTCDSELPPTMRSYRTQQFRWMKGMAQVARKLLPSILRAPLPVRVKVEAAAHLLAPLTYPMTLLSFVLLMPLIGAGEEFSALTCFYTASLLSATLAVMVFHAAAESCDRTRRLSMDFPFRFASLLLVGAGNLVNASRAVTEGLLLAESPFIRTPKRGDRPLASYTLGLDRYVLAEVLCLIFGMMLTLAACSGMWPLVPWTLLFTAGMSHTIAGQLRESFV